MTIGVQSVFIPSPRNAEMEEANKRQQRVGYRREGDQSLGPHTQQELTRFLVGRGQANWMVRKETVEGTAESGKGEQTPG